MIKTHHARMMGTLFQQSVQALPEFLWGHEDEG